MMLLARTVLLTTIISLSACSSLQKSPAPALPHNTVSITKETIVSASHANHVLVLLDANKEVKTSKLEIYPLSLHDIQYTYLTNIGGDDAIFVANYNNLDNKITPISATFQGTVVPIAEAAPLVMLAFQPFLATEFLEVPLVSGSIIEVDLKNKVQKTVNIIESSKGINAGLAINKASESYTLLGETTYNGRKALLFHGTGVADGAPSLGVANNYKVKLLLDKDTGLILRREFKDSAINSPTITTIIK